MTNQTAPAPMPEPVNSLGLLLAVAEHTAHLSRRAATHAEELAEKMAAGRMAINTNTIDQLALLLRQDLHGSGAREELRALVDQAWEDIYLKGWPVPTGRLPLKDRSRLRVAMAQRCQALIQKEK
ncbi:hypothetical protein AB0M72_06795 [Nocardiopsis dassonvillei]